MALAADGQVRTRASLVAVQGYASIGQNAFDPEAVNVTPKVLASATLRPSSLAFQLTS